MKRVHIYVSGIVQGVFFRHNTISKAKELGLNGWVRNLRDGRVEIICEGNGDCIDRMIEWCSEGPRDAYVENLDIRWEEFKNEFNSFQITY